MNFQMFNLVLEKAEESEIKLPTSTVVVMEPMQGKLASSQFDFGYTELFCIPGVTSLFFSSCDSAVGVV